MARIDPKRAAKVAAAGAALAVRYGPQAKLAWDKGGRQAAQAAARRAGLLRARRQAVAHAAGLVDGGVLELAPGGSKVYVVMTGTTPVAAYPPDETPLADLVAHADLSRIVPAVPADGSPGPAAGPKALGERLRRRG
jgi:hypothetical protein